MDYITSKEIAEKLKVSPRTVNRWVKSGNLRAFKVGDKNGAYRIEREDFDRFIEERTK